VSVDKEGTLPSHTTVKIGLGGGCHWCTEAVFLVVEGVTAVEQGFIASVAPYHAFSEAVLIHYDPERVTLADLLRIHLATHSSRSEHTFREKYRSAVYYFCEEQKEMVKEELKSLEPNVTKALPFKDFRPSSERYHRYFRKNHDKPFTRCHIEPKLQHLSEEYGQLLKRESLFYLRLRKIPEGYSERTYRGRRYGVTKTVFGGERTYKLFAEELGGSDFISCNLYVTRRGERLKPCEMPLEKVLNFLLEGAR